MDVPSEILSRGMIRVRIRFIGLASNYFPCSKLRVAGQYVTADFK